MTTFRIEHASSAIDGLITKASSYSVDVTLDRLESTLQERGYRIFARIDHADAAVSVGLKMPRSTVLIFGNPRVGTPNFIQQPTLAIDLPLKALIYEDATGKVWISYNSASYLYSTIYARHGICGDPAAMKSVESTYDAVTSAALE